MVKFLERAFTGEEVQRAKEMIDSGYKHRLRVRGSPEFKCKVREALRLIKTAKYYEFLRTYIRQIVEIGGFSQLREADVAIWANKYVVDDPVDAAGFFVQKAHQMKEYLEGRLYYGGEAEKRAVEKRIEFLKELGRRSQSNDVRKKCEEYVKRWTETVFP
ncbi:MAG: hypothetical protein AOA65_1187 [Candidatus Bathyarchaeota archaeon BA1]|nr:MAG: hypothetical protein AOA65_1187 [Candidatus Bathyarchaeota archaeon BA1]